MSRLSVITSLIFDVISFGGAASTRILRRFSPEPDGSREHYDRDEDRSQRVDDDITELNCHQAEKHSGGAIDVR